MENTFKIQNRLAVCAVVAGTVVSTLQNNDLYFNLALIVSGIMFAVNPVVPDRYASASYAGKTMRFCSVILIVIGLMNGFAV